MWLVYILYRSNLSAHCVWQISGMGTFPTLYLEELRQSKGKTLMYLLLLSRQVSLLYIKAIYNWDFSPFIHEKEKHPLWEQLSSLEPGHWLKLPQHDWVFVRKSATCHQLQHIWFQFQKVSFIYLRQQTKFYAFQVNVISAVPTNVSLGLFHIMSRDANIN